MTKEEILKIKEHIEIHARREPRAVHITQIMWKAVEELERIAELEKENAELKGNLELYESGGCRATKVFECGVVKELKEQLTKAIGIIKRWYETNRSACIEPSQELIEVTEQFLKEQING